MTKEVLVVTSHFRPNVGGVETHLDDLVSALASRDWKVIVSTYQPLVRKVKGKTKEKGDGYVVYRLPWPGFNLVHILFKFPVMLFLYLVPGLFVQTFLILLLNPRIVAVHAQGLAPAVTSLLLARLFGKVAVVSTHNLYFFPKSGFYTAFSRFIFSKFDNVLTLSNASSKEMARIGVKKSVIKPYRYWLNLDLFKQSSTKLKAKSSRQQQKLKTFFVGRLIETKGVLEILKSAEKLPEVEFVIAGPGVLEPEVKEYAHRNKNIMYLGPISQDEVKKQMNSADVVLAPSTVDEGYGRVAMEAIACGTPVIAANRGGLDEVVQPSVGMLVEPTEVELTKALKALVKNKSKLESWKGNTRKYAETTFSEDNVQAIINSYSKSK